MTSAVPSSSTAFSWRERLRSLAQASQSGQIFDLCIVGGGISGAACARDAALRGLKVLLVEKSDFASGTSSRSSKLVHGGVRYLEQYEFKLVAESTRERARLWKLAPQLVSPLPFLFPTFRSSRVPLWKLDLGLWLYDFLSGFSSPSLHRKYSREETLKEEPELRADDLKGSIFYWDGATNDAKLTLANIMDAVRAGATALSRVRLEKIEWNPRASSDAQQSHRLSLRDTLQDTPFHVQARSLLLTPGPWTDALLSDLNIPSSPILKPTRGSHIVVSHERLPAKHAVVMFHPRDQRVLFTIPWDECTVVGTTDLFDDEAPETTRIRAEEVDYLIEAANSYFPRAKLGRDDVISTWSGLRPLLAPPSDEKSASAVSREHLIKWFDPGLLLMTGGKLTTHREMAEEAIDKLFDQSASWRAPLGQGFRESPTATRPLPAFAFPASPALHPTEEDLRGICRSQMVLSLEDLLVRRLPIFYKDPSNGLDRLPSLEKILCEELGWSPAEWKKQVSAYQDYVRLNVDEPLGRVRASAPAEASSRR